MAGRSMTREEKAALDEHVSKDPEKDSEFARTKASNLKDKRVGVDKEGNTVSVSRRSLFNAFGGDERRANETFDEIARASGSGAEVSNDPNQFVDIGSLARSVKENQGLADRAEDLWERRQLEQRAQHQDNLYNDTMEALERAKKG